MTNKKLHKPGQFTSLFTIYTYLILMFMFMPFMILSLIFHFLSDLFLWPVTHFTKDLAQYNNNKDGNTLKELEALAKRLDKKNGNNKKDKS